jgi:cell division protein FtsB
MPGVRPLHYALIGFLLLLQYPLWLGSAGMLNVWQLDAQIKEQKTHNLSLAQRNQALEADVLNLKSGIDAIEERARLELGMVRSGEVFFQVARSAK